MGKGMGNWRLFSWEVQKSALWKEQTLRLSTLDFAAGILVLLLWRSQQGPGRCSLVVDSWIVPFTFAQCIYLDDAVFDH